MTYNEFEKTMLNLQESCERADKLSDEFKCDFFVEFTDPLIDKLVELLEYIFEDKNAWISYWMFDLDFGKNYEPGRVQIDGKDVQLKTINDLWEMIR